MGLVGGFGDAMIYTLDGRTIETEGDVFIAATAVVIGAVRLKHESSVWWGRRAARRLRHHHYRPAHECPGQ